MQDQLTRVERDYRVALDENAEAAAVIGKLKSKLEAKVGESWQMIPRPAPQQLTSCLGFVFLTGCRADGTPRRN